MKVSCIIPAFNEAERIKRVLDVVIQCPQIDEIIVVDDCSKDDTSTIVEKYNQVTLVKHEVNKGKSMAIYDGILKSSGDFLLFLDADLLNLTKENIEEIVRPILKGDAEISISLRGNAPSMWKYIGLDYISGERCFKRSILDNHLEEIKVLTGFGLEVFLNRIMIRKTLKIKVVEWPNVESPFKRKRFGIHWDFVVMGINIFKEISPLEALMQIIKIKKLLI